MKINKKEAGVGPFKKTLYGWFFQLATFGNWKKVTNVYLGIHDK